MTSTSPRQPTSSSGSPVGRHDIDVHGDQNVIIPGSVGGDLIVNFGGPDLRELELAYLADIIRRRQSYAEKYTPMPGVAEVIRKAVSDSLPSVLVPPEFMLLRRRGGGMQAAVERVPVSDVREAIQHYRRMVLLGEPGTGPRSDATSWWTRLPVPIIVATGFGKHLMT